MVDLPHPDGPTSTMNSPSPISRETSSTATTSEPKTFVTPSNTILAISRSLPSRRGAQASHSLGPEPLGRQGRPGAGQGAGACSQPLQSEQGCAQHGGHVQH